MDDLTRYAATGDPQLRDRLAVRHLPLVKFVARRMSSSLPAHIEIDDLVSWGALGLLDALEKFDPGRGIKFSTYAVTRIRGAILDGLQKMDWAPKQVTSKVRALRRLREEMTNELGHEPSVEEMAARLQVPADAVRGWLIDDTATRVRALDPPADDEDGVLRAELRDHAAEEQQVAGEVAEIRGRVGRALGCLGEREQLVFVLYYRDSLTLREIADRLGVSVSSVTQTHTRLVEQIRDRLALLGGVA